MASPNNPFRECLRDLDVRRAMAIWAGVFPKAPQPKNDAEMLITLHFARTQAESIDLKLRAWSHRWLLDNELPSGLPDELKPRAERICPKVVSAVGIAVKSLSGESERAKAIERAMSDAVGECYGDGITDTEIIKRRMAEARAKVK